MWNERKKLKPTTNARNGAYKKYSAVLNTSGWGWQSPQLPRGEAQDENALKMQTSVQQWDSALRVARAFMRYAEGSSHGHCLLRYTCSLNSTYTQYIPTHSSPLIVNYYGLFKHILLISEISYRTFSKGLPNIKKKKKNIQQHMECIVYLIYIFIYTSWGGGWGGKAMSEQ